MVARKPDYLAGGRAARNSSLAMNRSALPCVRPEHDLELAAGFLFTEGLVRSRRDQIIALGIGIRDDGTVSAGNVVVSAKLARGSCGRTLKGCGVIFSQRRAVGFVARHRSIRCAREHCSRPILNSAATPEILARPFQMRCALRKLYSDEPADCTQRRFSARPVKILALREDIGRHNAVDKAIGWALRENRASTLSNEILLVSGRGGLRDHPKSDCGRNSGGRLCVGAIEPGGKACARDGADAGRILARPALRDLLGRRPNFQ